MKKIDTNRIVKYRLDDNNLSQLMQKAHYVFDSSVLLNLYFSSENTLLDFYKNVLTPLKNRLWIPSQVEFEFLKNREDVILKPIKSYRNLSEKQISHADGGHIATIESEIKNIIDSGILNIRNQLLTLKEKTKNDDVHPHVTPNIIEDFSKDVKWFENQTNLFSKKLVKFRNNLDKQIKIQSLRIQNSLNKDTLLEQLTATINVGSPYDYNRLLEIAKEGRKRYDLQIPPGYEDDEQKIGLQKFGDLIIWYQLMDYSINENCSIILVTNDVKEDWWEIERKKRIGPRNELIKEFHSKTNSQFWMLTQKEFIHLATSKLKLGLDSDSVDEMTSQDVYESVSLKQQREERSKIEEEWLSLLREAVLDGEDIKANHAYTYKGKSLGTWLSLLYQRNKEGKKHDVRDKVIAAGFDNTKRGRNPEIVARRFINKLTDAINPDKGEFQRHFNSTMMPKHDVLKKETIKEVNDLWMLRFGDQRIWRKKSLIKDKIDEWKSYRNDKELNPDGNWSPKQSQNINLYKWVWTRKKDSNLLSEFKDRFTETEKDEMRKEGILI